MTVSTSTIQRHNCSLCRELTLEIVWQGLCPPCTAKACDDAVHTIRGLHARIAALEALETREQVCAALGGHP